MATTTQEKQGLFGRIRHFFGEVREEGNKVVWPEREKAKVDLVVVLIATVFLAVAIGAADLIFSTVFTWLLHS